jgi:xylose dehydrogenase (NAD/NADP)
LNPSISPLRIGVLGTARIGATFVRGASASHKLTVAAVASRDGSRAQRFAQDHGIPRFFGSYDELLADSEIDAVYNPLPNSLHAHWSIRALEAGKHVLCEKPLATTSEDARTMFRVAEQTGLQLVEGYPYRSQPLTRKLSQILAAGEIGRVELIQASFGFPMTDASNVRLNPTLGGGALWDAGCYPISLVRMIAGECPVRAHAAATWVSAQIDKTVVAMFEFATGLLAQVSCSFGTALHRHALIAGSAGIIETAYSNNPPMDRPATMQLRRGTTWEAGFGYESVEAPAANGFLAEAESFCDLITQGSSFWSGATKTESIDIVRMIEAVKRSSHSGHAEALA